LKEAYLGGFEMTQTLTMPITKVTQGLTMKVNITGTRIYGARLWACTQLIKLAAFVAGFGIKIDQKWDINIGR
jgi:hypothetical protein